MKKNRAGIFAALCLALLGAPPAYASAADALESPVFTAMGREMARSLGRLRFEDFKPPYFLSYQLLDSRDRSLTARYGALVQDQANRSRALYVELRTGSRQMDNTDENYHGLLESAPLADDAEAIRHRLWLMTDQAYKQAVRDTLRKQGKKIAEIDKDQPADFSVEKPQRAFLPAETSEEDLAPARALLEKASAGFRKYAEILDGGLSLRAGRRKLYYLNSEGTRLLMPAAGNPFFLYVWARAQSEDGMNLDVSRTFSAASLARLPDAAALSSATAEMAGSLLRLRKAKPADPYTGPAVLDPESTGVLFHEAVGHRLEGERQRDEEEGQTFKGQVGKAIIPAFLSVADDPTAKEYGGTDLNGAYAYDDEGVPAERVALVEKGVLKNYLMSRRPIQGFARSNGHGRAQFGRDPVGRMSNLFVKSEKEVSDAELKRLLLEECRRQNKPYGILIRRTRSGDTYTARGRYQAFRGTPEEVSLVDAASGAETLVRGVELVGTPLITINKILATGKDYGVMNAYCGAESGTVPVSTIAPAVLVQEVELQRVRQDKERPPILPAPLYDPK